MAGKEVVVEDGIIQCEHGGQVILKSSVENHTIGGRKPLYTTDILQAQIQGCTYNISNNGQCTQVAAISSAITETNIANQGKNYLLRVDGCQSDKGAALVLVDPGQNNTLVPVKQTGRAGSVTTRELEDAKLDTKENIKKEKYRIYPLRKSDGDIRPLRGARDFSVRTDTYTTQSHTPYTTQKIITQTDAYLYVTHQNKTTEYKVINQGDTFKPAIIKVRFKDTQTGIVRRYIPIYETSGDVELLYSSIRLDEKQRGKFTPVTLTLEDKKNSCIENYRTLAKQCILTEKEFDKKLIPLKTLQKKEPKHYNLTVQLEDPIGEVEDLYNEYEFSYHRHYAMNKELIENIRGKNQYVYAVADILDYLYVDEKETEAYNIQNNKLKKQYQTLIKLMQEDMTNFIEDNMIGNNLSPAIDYDIANEYYEEINFIDKNFFRDSYYASFSLNLSTGKHTFTSNRHFSGKRLTISSTKYKDFNKSAIKTLAFLTFSVCYGERYRKKLSLRLKEESEKFYYLIKTARPLPQINEQNLDEIAKELKHQEEYKRIFSGEDPLLDEFEQLDFTLKDIAYDPYIATYKRYPKNSYGFKSLRIGKQTQKIFYDNTLRTPKKIAQSIASILSNSKIADTLEAYKQIHDFKNDQQEHNYYNYLLNLSTMLISPRAKLDKETELLSPFNTDNRAILELLTFLTKQLNSIGKEKANRLHTEPIKQFYLKSLYTLIAHAELEKPNQHFPHRAKHKLKVMFMPPSDKGRAKNVAAFLKEFEQEAPKQSIKTDKLLDNNFSKDLKAKTESEKLYETLKRIDGVSSYLEKVDESLEGMEDWNDKSTPLHTIKNSKTYKTLLASTKTLSFLLTVAKINDYIQGKEKLKIHNIIGFADDTLSATHYITELTKSMGKEVPIASSIPKSLEHIAKIDKIVSTSSMKVIARFGLITAMANAINDLHTINLNKNEEYFISVAVKNALYVGLLFTPALFALGAIAIVEIAWFFLKDNIENSELELYLYESLLFNVKEHNKGRYFNTIESKKPYRAKLLLDMLKSNGGVYQLNTYGKTEKIDAMNLDGFINIDQLKTFIADNYYEHTNLMNNALKNELSRLKSTLYGMDITINKTKQVPVTTDKEFNYYRIYPYIDLPKQLVSKLKKCVELLDDSPVKNEKSFEINDDGTISFNTLLTDNLNGVQQVINSDISILIQTDENICLKYKIIYSFENTPQGRVGLYTLNILNIKEIKPVPVTNNDYKILGV